MRAGMQVSVYCGGIQCIMVASYVFRRHSIFYVIFCVLWGHLMYLGHPMLCGDVLYMVGALGLLWELFMYCWGIWCIVGAFHVWWCIQCIVEASAMEKRVL